MNRIATYFYFIVVLTLWSCNGKEELPEDIIPEQKMVDVMTEMEITQGLIKLKFSNQDSSLNQQKLFDEVYDEFDITKEQFNKSLAFYCEQPKLLEEIYVEVISNLSEQQAKNQ